MRRSGLAAPPWRAGRTPAILPEVLRPARSEKIGPDMRVIDLDTGDTLQAANDHDLVQAVKGFYEDRGTPLDDEEAARLVSERAYDATDA
jgi:hypothetical protein